MDLRRWVVAPFLLLAAAPAAVAEPGGVAGRVVAADGAGPIWVYLLEPSGRPRGRSPGGRVRIEQRDRGLVPPFLVLRQGQWVDFVNRDRVHHGLYSLSAGNEFDLGLLPEGESRSVEMRAPGEVEVLCDMHPEMSARILVLQNERFVRLEAGGTYALREVPPGPYLLGAWSPWHEPQRRPIRVKDGTVLQVDLSLRPRHGPSLHLSRRGTLP